MMRSPKKLVIVTLAVWFVVALSVSALGAFKNGSQRIGLAVAIAAVTPLLLFAISYAASKSFRQFALSLNPQSLTAIQSWRILGFVFVLLESRRMLPAIFALPAGYGDMAIGATATFVAWKLSAPQHRNAFIIWQVLGVTDLVMAVALGTTARILSPAGISMLPMTVLPLSLVPTFVVPLLLMLHVVCIAQARRLHASERSFRPRVLGVAS
jgi:hypothetical protein